MAPLSRRQRSSTAASASSVTTGLTTSLQPLIQSLHDFSTSNNSAKSDLRFQERSEALQNIHRFLADSNSPKQSRDAFRHLYGFQALLNHLRSCSGLYQPTTLSADEKASFFSFLNETLSVLSEALKDHRGNRRYFTTRVDGDGWASLEQAIASTGVASSSKDAEATDLDGDESLFGCLFGFAVGDEQLKTVFRDLRASVLDPHGNEGVSQPESAKGNGLSLPGPRDDDSDSASAMSAETRQLLEIVKSTCQRLLGDGVTLQNPEIITTIFNFWFASDNLQSNSAAPDVLSVSLLSVVRYLAQSSEYNLLAIHSTGILSILLRQIFDSPLPVLISSLLQQLATTLIKFGTPSLADAKFLYRKATESDDAARFLLHALQTSNIAPHIQFDLSLNGYSSVELANLGRTFPPISSSSGYSLAAWIYIDKFDANCHTTIFGAYDASQTCFVLAYLEKDTHNIILQTSVTSSKPSVRFKSIAFQSGRWYHICLVHRRPRALSWSKAALFVDGEFIEQLKCQYPTTPPLLQELPESDSALAVYQKHYPVQVFLGTPQALSSRLGKNALHSRWSLSSFHLFDEVLTDDLIAVYHRLGPKYSGNFQDCLGSFQTYEASAALNMRNEYLHPSKEDKSDIVAAIRKKAGDVMPESRILFNISPAAILDDDDSNNIDETQLVKSLSKRAAENLQYYTRSGSNAIAINCAIPPINKALTQAQGVAVLAGDPVVIVPFPLDDASWRVGGCAAVGLKMVQLAHTRETVLRAVEILFETVRNNWRNSEAMERQNAFSVLGALLRGKVGVGTIITSGEARESGAIDGGAEECLKLSLDLLRLVLTFVGYRHDKSEESIIINPLAYRILLVDFDLWRKSATSTQQLYYKQFVTFGVQSKYHQFNLKRLYRMRIVRRLLDALKGESFDRDIMPDFFDAFGALVKCNLSSEVLRSLALFVTYALQKSQFHVALSARARDAFTQSPRSTPRGHTSPSALARLPTSPGARAASTGKDFVANSELGIKVLEMFSELLCDTEDTANIKKFARTVTNKWLLYLLAEDEPRVVVIGARILSRLLVVHGSGYVHKFASKSGGFVIMKMRLRRWWGLADLWPILFAILLGQDIRSIKPVGQLKVYDKLRTLQDMASLQLAYPEFFPVIAALIGEGLKTVSDDTRRPRGQTQPYKDLPKPATQSRGRMRSSSLGPGVASPKDRSSESSPQDSVTILQQISRYLVDVHTLSPRFREFAATSTYVQELLVIFFPIIVGADPVTAETELLARDSALTFDGGEVERQPYSRSGSRAPPIVQTTTIEAPPSPRTERAKPLRRGSSFVLVTSHQAKHNPSSARLNSVLNHQPGSSEPSYLKSSAVQGILDIIIGVFLDQVLERKEFPGFGLFLKVPPGFQEHQAVFESYLLRNTLSRLQTALQSKDALLKEPKVLNNMSRLATHLSEAVFEGWFIQGAEPLLNTLGTILEFVQRPEVASTKNVRLCSQAMATTRTIFLRTILFQLSGDLDESQDGKDAVQFLERMTYWQPIFLYPEQTEGDFLRLICYLLYVRLIDPRLPVRLAAANLWRMILVQKPTETSAIFNEAMTVDQKQLSVGFKKLIELENDTFISWIDDHREDLDEFFFGGIAKSWEIYVSEENQKIMESSKSRIRKRKDRLKQWMADENANEKIIRQHESATHHWMNNIHSSEYVKHLRAVQDQQDTYNFTVSTFLKLDRNLKRPCGLLDDGSVQKWRLDQTEGRNRMRLRLLPDHQVSAYSYQPKQRQLERAQHNGLKLNTKVESTTTENIGVTPAVEQNSGAQEGNQPGGALGPEEEFEMVDDPREDGDGYEDKNRKVMRSLETGDEVQHVYNVSRIVGLEACEGLLILGKDCLYLLDHFFQRSDGEILNVWQAPKDERDPYLELTSGRESGSRESGNRRPAPGKEEQETRNWRWEAVVSISKRRFLFRDVAIEAFFTDGRSYLLTAISPDLRDELYLKLVTKAPHVNGSSAIPYPEDSWRLDSLRSIADVPQTFGTKFASVFNSSAWNPATRRWIKGEISNFHYLMLINTMAGRTFNDLTQYPVFPWVLADYTSEELDLENPRTFRDLSKPMGAQLPERQAEFRERYKSFAEMDHSAPAFHYGTHYSSAMIVTSYLIRLQPFVQSYLMLQGGNFDHADRLFYSIEKAWTSASRDNMTDVRELIPEFYYLPDFLKNSNGFDFGKRQGSGGSIDSVALPPWAKGDPKIFVTKHREALECPMVTRQLHQWIDLVFGFKQRGEAAFEATNVFHHLSYHGAKDLDTIEDPVERLATIGIIHNFGQTPHQVFQRGHPQREEAHHKHTRLDNAAETLTKLPFPLLESGERVASLLYSTKHERLLCSAAFRLNIPPNYDKYMEWGFADDSVRFYLADSRKLVGLFEHLHQGQLSCASFADSRTLITAGTDCTVSVWSVISTPKSVDLQPKNSLFGHNTPVTTIALSRSFSAFLTASTDGQVLMWNLNRLEFVRMLDSGGRVECASISEINGTVMLCRGRNVALFTLNGELLLDQTVCEAHDDYVVSCAFYEGTGNEWLEREIIFTGHRRGVVNVWNKVIRNGRFTLELIKRLSHTDHAREDGSNYSASITCVLPMAQVVYTGDDDGRVVSFKTSVPTKSKHKHRKRG